MIWYFYCKITFNIHFMNFKSFSLDTVSLWHIYCHAILTPSWNFFRVTFWIVALCSLVLMELDSIFDEIVGTVGRTWFGVRLYALSALVFCWGGGVFCWGGGFESDSWIGLKSLEMAFSQLWSTMVFIPDDELTKNVIGKIKR